MHKYRKSLPYTTPEEFCFWLHKWIKEFNAPIQQRWGWSFPLDPPSCIDIVQGESPYKIVVRRKPTDRRAVVNLWTNQREKEYPHDYIPPRRNDPPRRSEAPPYNIVALEITISKLGNGIEIEVDCDNNHGLQLEDFALALMTLEGKGQGLAGIIKQSQALLSQSELTGIPSALRDAIDMEREQKLLALGLTADGKQPTTKAAAQPEAPPEDTSKSRLGPKTGTLERVSEFHRLVKSGMSQRQAKAKARCDPSTYYQWCKQATGEEPIVPYR